MPQFPVSSFPFPVKHWKPETGNVKPDFLVGLDRLELSTSPLSGVRSSHLSYRPGLAFFFNVPEPAFYILDPQICTSSQPLAASF
jgi:hypothetical protein